MQLTSGSEVLARAEREFNSEDRDESKGRKPQRPDVNFYLLLQKLLSGRILIAVLNSLNLPRAVLPMLNYVIYRAEQQKKKNLFLQKCSGELLCVGDQRQKVCVPYLLRR